MHSVSASLQQVCAPGVQVAVPQPSASRPHALPVLAQSATAPSRQSSGCRCTAVAEADVLPLPHAVASPSQPRSKTVAVDLGDRSYPIDIGEGLLDDGARVAAHIFGRTALVVTNTTVAPLYLDRLLNSLQAAAPGVRAEALILPDGEQHKNLDVVSQVWTRALELRLDRKTTFIALGGGVIGDMTGYAAAAYQRGVNFIQIPTTVMATVDSSVGGKTGVNHALGKNMIGAFHQPHLVLVDTQTLSTLPTRELASGFSEVVKYGLIGDPELFAWLEANMGRLLARDAQALTHAIEQSCVNKARVVALDEREAGVRATLNLGHTFGHAMETWQGYGEWLHGEAVAAGTVMAAHMSHSMGWISRDILDRTVALLQLSQLPVKPPKGMTSSDFLDLMSVDKKVANGKMNLVLLKGPLGDCVVTSDFSKQALLDTLIHFCGQ